MNEILLVEEINRMRELVGLSSNYEIIKEVEVEKEAPKTSEQETISKVTFEDYLTTDEKDELPFPMKYAMLARDSSTFLKDMTYLFLKLQGEGKTTEGILQIIAPHLKGQASDFKSFLEALEKYHEQEGPSEYDKLLYKAATDIQEYGKDALARFFDYKVGDEKASISYYFNAAPDQLKLSPTGFWQIQFAARIAAGKQKYPEEEVFINSENKDLYKSRAIAVLESFYRKAIVPIAVRISGRDINAQEFHPDDTKLQIKIDGAIDKLKDKLHMYDVNKNFGAWALTIMKNEIIDIIKSMTTMELRGGYDLKTGISVYDAFEANNWVEWLADTGVANVDNNQLARAPEPISLNGETLYKYTFKSPLDAYTHFNDAIDGGEGNIFKHLDKTGKQKLKNIGALVSTRKYAGHHPPKYSEQPSLEVQPVDEQKDILFKELAMFAKQNAGLPFKLDVSKKKTGYEVQKGMAQKNNISDEQLDEIFAEDVGNAIYDFWTNYVIFASMWMSKPADEILRSVEEIHNLKRGTLSSRNIHISQRVTGTDRIKPTIVSDEFYNPKTNEVFIELSDYIKHGYSERKNKKRREEIQFEFNKKQRERMAKGEVSFELTPIQFKQISETIGRILEMRKKGEPGSRENIKEMGKISNIISRLSGVEIQFESKNL